jgi:hypothetical protein
MAVCHSWDGPVKSPPLSLSFVRPFRMVAHACPAAGCSYSTSRPRNLKQHLRKHTGERPFNCSGCSAAFASSSALGKHALLHAKPHCVCLEPGCGFVAANKSALVWHTRKAGHAASVECPFSNCNKRFKGHAALLAHKSSPAHAGEGGKAVCRTCIAEFDTVAEYTAHVRAHKVERLAAAALARAREPDEVRSSETDYVFCC